jgi:LacI family kdg operon repressor
MLDNVLRQFHSRHRGMRKAVISANGALTLQVARSLKRIGLHWGSDIGLLGFDELEWAELAGVGITTSNSPRGRLAMPRLSRWCVGLKAQRPRLRTGLLRRADRRGSTSR